MIRLVIDASQIRSGGGLTHLTQLLHAADPGSFGIERVQVWSPRKTLEQLPSRPWLVPCHHPLLEHGVAQRAYWQRKVLPRVAPRDQAFLFVPGGIYVGPSRPYVTMLQNLLPSSAAERGRYRYSRLWVRLLLLRWAHVRTLACARGVIFLNQHSQNQFGCRNGIPRWRSRVICHGVDDRFRREPRVPRAISRCTAADPFRLLYVSSIDLYKHQWNVVEAVGLLRRKGLPVALELVGAAAPLAEPRLRSAIARVDPQGSFVSYRGLAPYVELPATYHQADAFVFASSCEGFPITLAEAMGAGLPIACSRCDPLPEVLGDGGVYFHPESPGDIAAALETLLLDLELRTRIAWAAYNRARQYTWQRCAQQTFAFLAEVAQREGQ